MKIPKAAMPVVELLRERVPRPEELPIIYERDINDRVLRWGEDLLCPMGFDSSTSSAAPSSEREFMSTSPYRMLPNGSVTAFADWWDEQTDAQLACDLVWGKPLQQG